MIANKENLSQIEDYQIELANNLDLDRFIEIAKNGFGAAREGSAIRLKSPQSPENSEEFTTSLEFVGKHDGRPQGFWVNEGNGEAGTLNSSAVVFDRTNNSIAFVNPGSGEGRVSGVKIDHNHNLEVFSGPSESFPKAIFEAKKIAQAALKPKA